MSSYDYRGARDRIFGFVRDSEGKVKSVLETTATITERALLLALVEWAPNIFPSQSTLAKMLGTDARSVRRLVRACEAKGLLTTKPGSKETNFNSVYVLLCDPGLKVPPDAESPRTSSPATPDAESDPPRTQGPTKQTSKAGKEAGKDRERSRARQSELPLTDPKQAAEHTQLVEYYFEQFTAARGVKPPFDGRDGKAAKTLLGQCGLEGARNAVRGAFSDEWWRTKATIRSIAAEPAKFIGLLSSPGLRNGPSVQRGDSSERAAHARALREAELASKRVAEVGF